MENRWEDLDSLLLRPSTYANQNFNPCPELKNMFFENGRILVVGAGGLGCEILKNLALSGFKDIHVIDLDRIDLTNLNRQFLFRKSDVGQFKAEVAAKFVMERVSDVKITAHVGKIQDKSVSFYESFSLIVAGLDNVEARKWLNLLVHGLVAFDEDGNPKPETVRALIDGGTEGFMGQARVIWPYKTACYECTIGTLSTKMTYNFCTISETPRVPEHCISYVYLIEWEKVFGERKIDKDSYEDMNWIYETALKRAENFGIKGVTYMLTTGVVKNIIPAIASTNAIVAAACSNEALKIMLGCSKSVDDYFMYMGQTGVNTNTMKYEKLENCLICSNKKLYERFN